MPPRLAKDGDRPQTGRSGRQNIHIGWVVALAVAVVGTSGCSRTFYRRQADRQTYQILAEKNDDPRWAIPDFDITPDPRSRFHDRYDPDRPPLPPDDPAAGEYMECVYGMRGSQRWSEHGELEHVENPCWPTDFGGSPISAEDFSPPRIDKLTPAAAIQTGLIHSRDYQEQLENVYLAALSLTYQRYRFDVRPIGFLGEPGTGLFHQHQPDDASQLNLGTTNLGFQKLLPGGAQLVAELTNNTIWLFSGSGGLGTASSLGYSIVQPLLAGGGREVALENLTQAERNVLYVIRDFARFRKDFYVTMVTGERAIPLPGSTGSGELAFLIRGERSPTVGFYFLLYHYQRVRNMRLNVQRLEGQLRDIESLVERGRATSLDATQVETSLENARSWHLYAQRRFGDQLDRFKLQLGLPPDMEIELDDSLLEPFQFISPRLTALQDRIRDVNDSIQSLQQEPDREEIRATHDELVVLRREILQAFDVTQRKFQQLDQMLPMRKRRMDEEQTRRLERSVADDLESYGRLREEFESGGSALQAWSERLQQGPLLALQQAELVAALAAEQKHQAQTTRRLTGLETGVRAESIVLKPVDLTDEEAISLALENRLDLMNRRGFVMDARRKLEIAADRLKATVNLVAEGQVNTPPIEDNKRPLGFRATQSEFRAGLSVVTPLDRRAARNNFRAAQISYQRARRNYMTAEDQVKLDVRRQMRYVWVQGEVFDIRRRALRMAAKELEQAIESGEQATESENVSSQQGLNIPRALRNILESQNSLIDTWVDYETARLSLYRDVGIMQIDASGTWIDE